ncbi:MULTISPECIES: bifunctional 23S rRNA (guanine(2069)-N(7))-methyltransferase RlmK/23S rRNA (guanine(2445)-N(2))-methyltransferase RlmL [unclassified Neptuniibacter]|uniref:bifunctional 23S rRNA (guanine(2069)-N(7))-methyltransferase RlmK/23S rRNA (guanine(2445)-N(2))-methyltransferase RlmL n=1 Tax=unclassified Neptuniibacter TaxID=2630693 RepID=UPI0026E3005B|nr:MULTISPECIES: bifunctional 23S rRNA (guanine(2069)-N(7))-methyltransferase RlmK/23S rRNA (guanine(2445)-N(2))-methyltransferase RlmL [unclassified Neptuniibacter]MDO6513488.1 bifunctional 23S rRNA (guanine(2069)-N(7))-methyltransferase RlmK/23S rRNA (guanine(2445)-N(2))-methyltransferase RlmL [Neptuniibacter sp. 2_MG-2023]MDO6594017.1 bifunctional 23S rRNA (guanine(2069)-N(7))-methyltransferase RlmK/23S rRNA (guanine(2445)-N(2))-methyltransferase RlmL [Neptuniibacter sp. 1_MG-2023]
MKLFLTCPKGLELLLEEELHQLGVEDTKQTVAGVQCHGDLEDAYRICLWSRLANRVLMPVYQGDAETTEDLYDAVQQVDWLDHMRSEGTLLIDFTGQTRAINNTHFGALKVKDAIVDQIRDLTGARPSVDKVAPDLRINVRMHRGKVTVAIDLSGDSLHRRAYRLQAGQAPMKENLAAAVLLRSGWPARIADFDLLLDPMCGSGTLLIEAAMMAADIAPGLQRKRYGFSRWTGHQKGIWDELVAEANGRKAKGLSQLEISLVGRDEDKSVLRSARQNAERAGVAEFIDFAACRVEDLEREQLPQGVGLLVTNPPYGERLGETQQLMFLYRHLGDKLKEQFAGWTAAIFTSNPDLCKVMGMRADKQYKLFNGALESRLFVYPISEHRPEQRVREEEEVVPLSDGAQMFANRLLKNRKQLAKWVKKEQIECYRLYDADMPEYSVAIDIYGDEVHVQEYAAPKKIDPVKTFSRLQEVMAAIPVALDIPANKVILKQRKKQQGSNQYEKQSETHRFKEVNEYGCRLLVNLHDYLDTGLFLDHRPIRYRIQQESAGKDVLNLFCYTGTASVHAAKGGAKTTTSIDMSATYLNWAKRNLDLNGFDQDANQQVQGDCLKWLRMQRQPAYDLIFMDPPTFSNSKRMEGVLDVQRDHVDMVDAAMRLLRKEGVLYFSNNYRRFKIDHEALSDYVVEDITYSTLDPDFKRNQRIHSCFRITHKL